jgi:hypothetical protein
LQGSFTVIPSPAVKLHMPRPSLLQSPYIKLPVLSWQWNSPFAGTGSEAASAAEMETRSSAQKPMAQLNFMNLPFDFAKFHFVQIARQQKP